MPILFLGGEITAAFRRGTKICVSNCKQLPQALYFLGYLLEHVGDVLVQGPNSQFLGGLNMNIPGSISLAISDSTAHTQSGSGIGGVRFSHLIVPSDIPQRKASGAYVPNFFLRYCSY